MKNYYSFNEVCEVFGVSRKTVYNWVDAGKLPEPQYINGRPMWKKTKINQIFNYNSGRADSRRNQKRKNMKEIEIEFVINGQELLDYISGLSAAVSELSRSGNYTEGQMFSLLELQRLLADGLEDISNA